MAMSNFPSGVTSFGFPVIPDLPVRHDSQVFIVNPGDSRASDANPGSVERPMVTVSYALSKAVAGRGDVIVLIGDGTNGSNDTAEIAWSKDNTHLVGLGPSAKIAPSTTFASLLNVSADGCVFRNVHLLQAHNADSTALTVSGNGNRFEGCRIEGIAHATAGDAAGAECILLSGNDNVFSGCEIGTTAVARSAAGSDVRLAATATDNKFVDCDFVVSADNAGALHVAAGASTMSGYLIFRRCSFVNVGGTTMTVAMSLNASPGGSVILDNCLRSKTITDWASSFTPVSQLGLNSGTALTDMGAAIAGS